MSQEVLQRSFIEHRFGMFICYNIMSYGAKWGQAGYDISGFNPQKLDCNQWAEAAVSAGMKFGLLTTKHHEGFCLWDSAYTDYDVAGTPYKKDIVKQYVDAFRAKELRIGLYYSIWDSTHGVNKGSIGPKEIAFIKGQIRELLTNYGEVDYFVVDGWFWKMGHHQVPYTEIREYIRELQPNCLITDHTHLQAVYHVDIPYYEGPFGAFPPEGNTMPSALGHCSLRGNGWFWSPKTPNGLHSKENAQTIAAKLKTLEIRYCNFMLNCMPNRDGLLDPLYIDLLAEIGTLWKPDPHRPPLPAQEPLPVYTVPIEKVTAGSGDPEALIDACQHGSRYVHWISDVNMPQTITLDLGAVYKGVDALTIVPNHRCKPRPESALKEGNITKLKVFTGTGKNEMTLVAEKNYTADAKPRNISFPIQPTRYLRIEIAAAHGPNVIIAELAVGGANQKPKKMSSRKNSVIATGPFEATYESLAQSEIPEWIQDAKLGFWAHWGPQAQPARGDWYARGMYIPGKAGRFHYEDHVKTYGHPSKVGFKDVIAQWKAEKFTPAYADYLMKLYKAAGAQFFVSIAHHHDNFDLWDSKHHSWNAVEKGPKKNIFRIWEKAARDNGLRFGLTSHLIRSPGWWAKNKSADTKGPRKGIPYDGADPAYADLYHPKDWESAGYDWYGRWYKRLKDVIDQHRPDFIYVDGGIPIRDIYGYQLVAHYYNQNMADHNGKLEGFILSKEIGDRAVGMYDIEYSVMTRKMPFPWMSDTFIGHWFWNSDFENGDIPFGSSDFQIDHLIDVVSKNGVVMMVVPQRGDGTVHDRIIQTLIEMGDWMKVNSEGIHSTRPWRVFGEGPTILKPGVEEDLRTGKLRHSRNRSFRGMLSDFAGYTREHLRYTQSKDGKTIYAFVLGWPGAGEKVRFNALSNLDNPMFTEVTLLGHGPIRWEQDENWLVVTLPDKAPFEQALCFKVVR